MKRVRIRSCVRPTGPRTASRGAFSLVETMVAVSILGLAVVPVLALFSSSGRQARQTSDHGLALALGQKAGEELHLGAWENPHLLEVVESDPSRGNVSPVVDGGSPFFAVVEDMAPPYGRMTDRVDPGITNRYQPLFRQVRSFRFGYAAGAVALTTGTALDLVASTTWDDFQDRNQEHATTIRIGRYTPACPSPSELADRARADAEIARRLYRSVAATPLPALVAAAGGDLAMVRHLGDVATLSAAISGATTSYEAEVGALRSQLAAATTPSARGALTLALARADEARAAACLEAMVYLARPLETLSSGFTPASLGSPRPAPQTYTEPARLSLRIGVDLARSLGRARSGYLAVLASPLAEALPRRHLTRALMKAVEVIKLQVVLDPAAGVTELARLLDDFRRYQEDRNPNFAMWAARESQLVRDRPTLVAGYPAIRREGIEGYYRSVRPAVKRIESSSPPGGR